MAALGPTWPWVFQGEPGGTFFTHFAFFLWPRGTTGPLRSHRSTSSELIGNEASSGGGNRNTQAWLTDFIVKSQKL